MKTGYVSIIGTLVCALLLGCGGKKTTSYSARPATQKPVRQVSKPTPTAQQSTPASRPRAQRSLSVPRPSQQIPEDKVLLVFIRPTNLFENTQEKINVDGQPRVINPAREIVSFYVNPGRQYLYSHTGTAPAIKSKLKQGKAYYFYNPDDARSQVMLGDLLYDKENFAGALGAYRKGTKLDSTLTDHYERYAKVVISHGKSTEIERVMKKVISLGRADATTFLGLGKVYQAKKLYPQAIAEYQKCLDREPENVDAMMAIADCKAKQGKISEAIHLFEQAIPLNPSSPNEYRTLGDLYKKQGQPDKAMQAYKSFLQKGGKSSALAFEVGSFEFKRRNYVEAVTYLAMVKGKKAKTSDYLLQYSESLYHAGEFNKAVPLFKKVIGYKINLQKKQLAMYLLAKTYEQIDAQSKALYWYNRIAKTQKAPSAEVSYKRAFLNEKTKKSESIRLYQQNVKRFPRDYRNFLRLGILYAQKKATLSKSAVMLNKAVQLADTVAEAWIEISRVYNKMGRSSDAIKASKKYLSFNPDSPEANARLGVALISKGRISEGIPILEKAYAAKPNDPKVVMAMAKGYKKSGKTAQALEYLLKAEQMQPRDVTVKKQLINLYKQTGKEFEAQEKLKELISINPDNALRIEYATILKKQNQFDEAANVIEDIRAVDPENIKALLLLGDIYLAQEKYPDALDIFKEITFIDQNNAYAVYKQAEVFLAQSKPLWAEKYYQNALKKNTRLAEAEYGLAKIAKLRNNKSLYRQHVLKAYQLNPKNPEIKAAYQSIR